MVVKVAGGVLGIGLIGTGGIAMIRPHWLGMDYMPEFHTLSKDNDYSTEYTDATHFGKKYGKYLVGVTNENQKTDKNQKFWEWAFRRLSRETITQGKFTNKGDESAIKVSEPHNNNGGSGSKALNQVCKAAYKTKESEFHDGTGTNDGTKFNKDDVWKYCSPIGQKPTTVKEHDRKTDDTNKKYENGEENDKIGKNQESTLISVFDKGNDIFWDMRNKEIKDGSLSVDASHTFFKKAKDENKHIKDLCGEAYDKPSTVSGGSNPSPTADQTKKYCSLDGTS